MPWKRAPSCATGPLSGGQTLQILRKSILAYPRGIVKLLRSHTFLICEKWENQYAGQRHRMNFTSLFRLRRLSALPLLLAAATAQTAPSNTAQTSPPVSYSSMSQLNLLLSQLEQASQATQADLAKTRVEKWK